jgi:PAP2 superfamily
MKKITTPSILLAAFILILTACSKDFDQNTENWGPLKPTRTDGNAGGWKTIILASGSDIAVPAPSVTTSPEYQAELQATKQALSAVTDEQKKAITYWSAGGVLRWNEIMRELVAKYNLPTVVGADGVTYPIPDSNNPFNYPQFPFSNPPYASRSYAYVTAAQYDALVAAANYRKNYNRPAPYVVDATIKPLVPTTDQGTYPSEDAVLAAATLDIMKALFPTEIPYLEGKAAEHKNYRLWAGATVASDIAAGEALGKAVAAKFLARFRTDGMKNAVGNQVKWDSLAKRVTDQGETPWISLEHPVRPPMLPIFGKVKPWLFPASQLPNIRPPVPFKTGSAEIKAQLAEVKKEASSNDRKKLAIVHYWADGAGTYTPPGHWNSLAADKFYQAQFSEVRTARGFALLNMAMMDAAISCWETKYTYYYPRPSQLDPSIKTLTGVPNFPAYTSGHSTFSGSAAAVLGYLFPESKNEFDDMAKEASLSRLYGGIHYRMDCDAGLKCGYIIGGFAVDRAKGDGGE